MIIINDYGQWKGARQAVYEYVTRHRLRLMLHWFDSSGRMAVKLDV